MKKWTKILCCALGLGFAVAGAGLAGCGAGDGSLSTDFVYNGPSAVLVGDDLYFGNGINNDFSSASSATEGDYNSSAAVAYLARLNVNIDNLTAKNKDFSPKNIANISGEVTAYTKSFTFALGNDVYYTAPNTKKDNAGNHYYANTTLFKTNRGNGDRTEIYTTTGEVNKIEALKFNNKYFLVMLEGSNLVKINLTDGGNSTIASNVTSVAIPKTFEKNRAGSTENWNGDIYYTTNKSNTDFPGNEVRKVSISGGESEFVHQNSGTISFVGREENELFYTLNSATYNVDVSKKSFASATEFVHTAITNETKVVSKEGNFVGYLYNASNGLYFKSNTQGVRNGEITFKNGSENLTGYKTLVVDGKAIVLLTADGIYKADLSEVFSTGAREVSCTTIVNMTDIYDDNALYAYDGTYVYYYAKLEAVEKENEDDPEPEVDEYYYLCRSALGKTGVDNYQLLGQASVESRRTK